MRAEIVNFQQRTNELLDAIALIPDRQRSVAPEGEWSAAYVIHHVADGELHFAARYFFTLGSDNPTMTYFDEDAYPEALHYEKRSLTKSLAAIVGIRAMVFEILSNLDDSAWSRQTTTIDGKSYSLTDLVTTADGHTAGHIEQLKGLAAQI
jgi:uncharacterized damage-inducible protein DinB